MSKQRSEQTKANKARRAQKRLQRANSPAAAARAALRKVRHDEKYALNLEKKAARELDEMIRRKNVARVVQMPVTSRQLAAMAG